MHGVVNSMLLTLAPLCPEQLGRCQPCIEIDCTLNFEETVEVTVHGAHTGEVRERHD